MKIYISGKITGIEPEAARLFRQMEQKISDQGHMPINPMRIAVDGHLTDLDYDDHMHIDRALIDVSDAVVFLDNWRDSRGAQDEFGYAAANSKMILFESDVARGIES